MQEENKPSLLEERTKQFIDLKNQLKDFLKDDYFSDYFKEDFLDEMKIFLYLISIVKES